MTRKDFELIANKIAGARRGTTEDGQNLLDYLARDLAETISETHPRFDSFRFLVACGVWQETEINGITSLVSGNSRVFL